MNFLSETVSNHQGLVAATIGVLVLVIIILTYFVMYYRKMTKAGFEGLATDPSGFPLDSSLNYTSGGAPQTAKQIRKAQQAQMAANGQDANGDVSGNWQASTQQVQSTRSALLGGGANLQTPDVSGSLCGANWDPAASAEAQALATAGSYDHDSYGEAGLQKAINGAYSQQSGIPTSQIVNLMSQGATA